MFAPRPKAHRVWILIPLFLALLFTTIGLFYAPSARPLWVGNTASAASGWINTSFQVLGYATMLFLAARRRDKRLAWQTLATKATEAALVHLLKFSVGAYFVRPSGGSGGFPSGHTAQSWALALLLSEQFPLLSPLWYAIAALISWSRVPEGAHYPYQVFGGMAVGMAAALLWQWRFRRANSEKAKKKHLR